MCLSRWRVCPACDASLMLRKMAIRDVGVRRTLTLPDCIVQTFDLSSKPQFTASE
jgi:hypothetical protein